MITAGQLRTQRTARHHQQQQQHCTAKVELWCWQQEPNGQNLGGENCTKVNGVLAAVFLPREFASSGPGVGGKNLWLPQEEGISCH